ncbi:MAG: hypothetical protein J6J31_09075 [Thermoguttaceae bacterium]|nr:hypothetical protein [Thermoguttaceae bacterium]
MKKNPAQDPAKNFSISEVSRREFCGSMAGGLLFLALPASAVCANGAGTDANADAEKNAEQNAGNDAAAPKEFPCFSGIYPHLANFNREGECGTGAVVPWAGKLWTISYAPHAPWGSTDKLYEISPSLEKVTRPESIGGTPANRMIHPESNQLFIGPYVIDAKGNVRVIDAKAMPGRHTGNARHLTDPANKIYYATMEEGFYEVDVRTLEVKQLYCDSNRPDKTYRDILPGYHGKGFYSAQERIVYSNNGERTEKARRYPDIESGALGQWSGKDWEVVLRNQFTEVTGPGGILGSHPERDTIWAVGWDYRSLILLVLDGGKWFKYRLPKGSHCYDGAHGWNTEWPRIREIGDPEDLLMTMHGLFWHFPAAFCAKKAVGIRPRAAYLKVIGDFCRWNDRLVFGCDDTAKSEFLNKSPFKGTLAEPGQSNSNLWFLEPEKLDSELGRPLGRGAVWFNETVEAGTVSDPYLFGGWDLRGAHIRHDAGKSVDLRFEVDLNGDGNWTELRTETVSGEAWIEFPADVKGEWIRVSTDTKLPNATCFFQYAMRETRSAGPRDARFEGLAAPGAKNFCGSTFWVRADNQRLAVVSQMVEDGKPQAKRYYELTEESKLVRSDRDFGGGEQGTIGRILNMVEVRTLPENVYRVDEMSVICTVEGQEFRLPIACDEIVKPQILPMRLDREAATERDLFHCAGMFYELPAVNAGGLPKVRPVARDGKLITDYASYRGLMVLGGIEKAAMQLPDGERNPHIIVSEDGKAALWAGAIDDLWTFGKPAAKGFFWKNSAVKANVPSLPFLMTGFDKKTLTLTNHGQSEVSVRIETDLTATGVWNTYRTFTIPAGETLMHEFPAAFQSYWFRAAADTDAVLSGEMVYA